MKAQSEVQVPDPQDAQDKIVEFIRDWGAAAMDDKNAPWKLKQFARVMVRRGWEKKVKV